MANLIDLKDFACHWRFVTRSQQRCSISFLLPDIEISSFSLSGPLLQCFNRQARKRNNLAKEGVANVSLGVVEHHVTYTKCPPLDITVIIIYMTKLLDSDWLRKECKMCNTSAKKCNTSAKSVIQCKLLIEILDYDWLINNRV